MKNSTLSPLEKLTQLSAQRTARTQRLHSAIRDLTDALEAAGCRPSLSVTVDGWTLGYFNVRSNVGVRDCWSLRSSEEYCTDLGFDVGHEGYLHGDLHCEVTGPTRAHLIAFGQRAEKFVAAIVAKIESSIARLESAEAGVASATMTLANK